MARRTLALALASTALLLGSCGVEGSDDGAEDTTETTAEATAPEPTRDELIAILPTAEDLGGDYELDEDVDGTSEDDDGESSNTDLEEACPALAEITLNETGEEDQVRRTFITPDERGVEVALDPTPEFSEEDAQQLVDAVNECGTVTAEDADGTMSMTLAAEADDSVGDYGVRMDIEGVVSVFGFDLELAFEGRYFVSEGIGASVFLSSGLDDETFESIPADSDLLDPLSEQLESGIASL